MDGWWRVVVFRWRNVAFGVMISGVAWAHEGHHVSAEGHSQEVKLAEVKPKSKLKDTYRDIAKVYDSEVRQIFESKCADCHSNEAPMPWYYAIPLVNRLLDHDRTEAQEHLEISKGFPFAGHGTPDEDLAAIDQAVKKDSMPTRFYRLMHPSTALSKDEKKRILDWTERSRAEISKAIRE